MFYPLTDRRISAVSVHLRPPGKSRTHLMFDHIPWNFFPEFFHILRALRSWPDQAHIPHQHIDKLRELVYTRLTDESSDGRNPRIILNSPLLLLRRLILDNHRTKLIHPKRLVLKADPFLTVDQRSRRRNLNDHGNHCHHRCEQDQRDHCTEHIHTPLHQRVQHIIKRYPPYIDNRHPQQVFRIRLGWDNVVIVRNELRMHSRLLTHTHDMFQLVVFRQSKRDHDLIQLILRQYDRQVLRTPDHLDPFVLRASLHIICKDPPDDITPLRIRPNPVDILFRRPAVPDHHDMLLIITLPPHIAQTFADNVPDRHFHTDVNTEKYEDHQPGEIRLSHDIEIQDERHHSDHIRLYDMPRFKPSSLYTLRRIQLKDIVQDQIRRHEDKEASHIISQREKPRIQLEDPALKPDIPCRNIGKHQRQRVNYHMEPV